MPKTALVLGAGGFIGGHLMHRLKSEGFWVRGVDMKFPEYREIDADDFILGDLRDPVICREVIDRRFDEVYQLAADMGGAGYIFTGEHDATLMHNSASINLNVLEACRRRNTSGSSTLPQHACTQLTIKRTRTIPIARKIPLIPRPRIANMAGKNSSANNSIWHSSAIAASPFALHGTITFLGHWELGKAVVESSRSNLPQSC